MYNYHGLFDSLFDYLVTIFNYFYVKNQIEPKRHDEMSVSFKTRENGSKAFSLRIVFARDSIFDEKLQKGVKKISL